MERPMVLDVEAAEARDDGPGISARAGFHAGVRYALVEYGPGAARAEWCEEPHQGFVLSGTIRYELPDGGVLTAREGQAFVLPEGTPHRGSNPGADRARIFLVDREG